MNKFGIAEIYRRGFSAGLSGLTSKPEDSGHWVNGFNDGYKNRTVFHQALNMYLLAQGLEPMSEIKTQEEVVVPAEGEKPQISVHVDSEIGMTLGETLMTQLPDGSWEATCPIEAIFGSEVQGDCRGVGPTKEAALEALAKDRKNLNDSLWA